LIIDCHTHGMHGNVDALMAAGGEWSREAIGKIVHDSVKKPALTNPAERLSQLDRNGFDYQVVTPQWSLDTNHCPTSHSVRMAYSRAMNDNMARLQQEGKGRLFSVGNVPLEDYDKGGRAEAERAVKGLGFKALYVCSNVRSKPLDAPEFDAFWAHAQELDVPVLIHPGEPVSSISRPYEARYRLMHNFGWPFETMLALAGMVFSGVMDRYPGLKVVSHHCGGGLPFLFGRTAEQYENRLDDTIGRSMPKPIMDYFRLFYHDTAVGGSPQAIRCTRDVFGADHMVFATDAPYGPGSGEMRLQTYPTVLKSVGLSDAENKKIMEDTPRRLFKI
jgi:predicted TIM-barrel fold metal-dependent hydrolase